MPGAAASIPVRPRRLLFVAPVTPAASGNGLAMRAGLFLEGLSRSHEVRVLVVPVFGPAAVPGELVERCAASFSVLDAREEALPDLAKRLRTVGGRTRAAALHPLPRLARRATLAAADAIAAAAADCETVHVMRLYLAPVLDRLIDSRARPHLSLDLDELETAHDADTEGFARLADYYLPRVDQAFGAAPEDIRALEKRCPTLRVAHVPNAVAIPEHEPEAADAKPADLLFVGNLSYAPNVEGASWLVERVLPRLGRVELNIVGSRPTDAVRSLGRRSGVTVVADVPSVTPWYAHSRVAVVPLLRGGGTRIKAIEALVHARPVVATPVGARGLGLSRGPDAPVLIGQNSDEFAHACRRLLEDHALARRLGAEGRSRVARTLCIDRVASMIDAIVTGKTVPREARER